jgi:uncharacterized membrane protein (DUF485 family)
MRSLSQTSAILGALILGAIAIAAYVIAFALRLMSAILAGLTIMMAGADHSTRRGNRMRAFYRMRSRGRGIGF